MKHGPVYLALAGLWGGAALVSLYLVVNYTFGMPLSAVALYFMCVPFSLAVSLFFFGKGLWTIIHPPRMSLHEILEEKFSA